MGPQEADERKKTADFCMLQGGRKRKFNLGDVICARPLGCGVEGIMTAFGKSTLNSKEKSESFGNNATQNEAKNHDSAFVERI